MLFSGTVFVATEQGFSVELVPWSAEASYRMPVSVWRELVDAHFPGSAWLRCSRETLDALSAYKARHALPTWDATLTELARRGGAASRSRAGPGRRDGGGAAVNLDSVRKIADAVLYEGYILYPYRASAQKNQSRWQFGVVMAPGYAAADPSETSFTRAECVLEHTGQPAVRVLLRFLQVQRRTGDGDGRCRELGRGGGARGRGGRGRRRAVRRRGHAGVHRRGRRGPRGGRGAAPGAAGRRGHDAGGRGPRPVARRDAAGPGGEPNGALAPCPGAGRTRCRRRWSRRTPSSPSTAGSSSR